MSPLTDYEADLDNLHVREILLDKEILSNPIVQAQIIYREYIKLCLETPEISLKGFLVLEKYD